MLGVNYALWGACFLSDPNGNGDCLESGIYFMISMR